MEDTVIMSKVSEIKNYFLKLPSEGAKAPEEPKQDFIKLQNGNFIKFASSAS